LNEWSIRLAAVVTSCGVTRFQQYLGGDLAGWSGPRYMPLIKSRYNLSPDQMPFDFAKVMPQSPLARCSFALRSETTNLTLRECATLSLPQSRSTSCLDNRSA
jgi:hypothetical protein